MNQEFIITRKVRFGDCDPGGILYTPRISYFVIEAVLDFISECFGAPAEKSIIDLGILPPARSFKVEFLKPMAWDDQIEIKVLLKEMRNSSIVFSINGYVLMQKVFMAELTQVCIHPETGQPIKIPTKLREVLEDYNKK